MRTGEVVSSRLPRTLYQVLHSLPASGTSKATSPSDSRIFVMVVSCVMSSVLDW